MFRAWSAVAEPRQMYLATVPTNSTDPQLLWHRFAEILGIDPTGYRDPVPARANPSLSMAAAEVLRRVNTLVDDLSYQQYRRGVTTMAYRMFGERSADEPPLQVPAAYRDWVEQRALQMNAELTKLEVNIIGDLDDLLPTSPAPNGVQAVEIGDAEMLDTAVAGLAATARILAQTRIEHDALEHRHAARSEEWARLKEQLEESWLRQKARKLVRRNRLARRIARRGRATLRG